ncbi:hypothetical protein K2173_022997 [Erythroxylum novogranatense]|uniref:4-coumarate--CoA ligase n=1 Tax=Erythroxylum novogranatense TaxID=1862640 RepID=A0AAV8T8C9_9ROSI|nr:hypothetical protein K2173_022997 [Erythroxylum novogranatense]
MDQLKSNSANSCPLTPLGFLERAAIVYGESTSIVYNNSTYTWSQTHRRCLRLASSLVSSFGVQRGQVVSVVAANIPAMYELQFAVPMSGAVLNNINTRLDACTLFNLLTHSESKLVFVDSFFSSLVLEAVSMFSKPPVLVLIVDDNDDASPTVDFITTYEEMVENGDSDFKWVRPKSEWDPIVLNYTSGTTSHPKGVVHCHRGIYLVTVDYLVNWAIPKNPVYLWTLPIFHSNGWSFPWGMAAVGGTNICLRKVDAAKIYRLIKQHGVTHMCGAPVLFNILTNSPHSEPLKNPINFMTGGSPPPVPMIVKAESLGFIVTHAYGLTEVAGPVVTCAWKQQWDNLPPTERARLKARQGVRTAGVTAVDVVDAETGGSVKRDGYTVGDIVLKGGCVMLGYLKDQVATSACIRENGWFYTGDLGVMHQDGYLEIKDRSKDVIISGGENINSIEVESVVHTNTAVNEVAVVAKPDEFWGETPCAFVSLKSDVVITEKEIIEFCRERMAHYMVPKRVVFMEELPKTSTGKIQKYLLRQIAKTLAREGNPLNGYDGMVPSAT